MKLGGGERSGALPRCLFTAESHRRGVLRAEGPREPQFSFFHFRVQSAGCHVLTALAVTWRSRDALALHFDADVDVGEGAADHEKLGVEAHRPLLPQQHLVPAYPFSVPPDCSTILFHHTVPPYCAALVLCSVYQDVLRQYYGAMPCASSVMSFAYHRTLRQYNARHSAAVADRRAHHVLVQISPQRRRLVAA
eukprot:1723620-Rhodomonas_salina.1